MPEDTRPYLNVKWLDEDAPALYDWYDEYPFDLDMWRTLCRDVQGPILDLACGTGRVAIELARAGHRVVGLDVSPAMIGRAKAKLQCETEDVQKRVSPVVGDMVDFSLGTQFRMAIMPCLSFHEIGTAEAQEACLRAVRRHLDDGGRFVLALGAWKPGKNTSPLDEPAEWGPPSMDEVNPHTGIATRMWGLTWYDLASKTRFTRFYFEERDSNGNTIRKFAMPPAPDWSRARFLDYDEACSLLEQCGFAVEQVYGGDNMNPFTPGSRLMTFDARNAQRWHGVCTHEATLASQNSSPRASRSTRRTPLQWGSPVSISQPLRAGTRRPPLQSRSPFQRASRRGLQPLPVLAVAQAAKRSALKRASLELSSHARHQR